MCRAVHQSSEVSRVQRNMRSRYEMKTDGARARCSMTNIRELMGKQHSAADRLELSSDAQLEEFGFLATGTQIQEKPKTAPKRLVRGSQSRAREIKRLCIQGTSAIPGGWFLERRPSRGQIESRYACLERWAYRTWSRPARQQDMPNASWRPDSLIAGG